MKSMRTIMEEYLREANKDIPCFKEKARRWLRPAILSHLRALGARNGEEHAILDEFIQKEEP